MALISTINYTDGSDFTFDSSKIEFPGSLARLKLELDVDTFDQDFASSTGFTFNASASQFTAGKVEQIDKQPTNSTAIATYTSSADFNYGSGTLTGTLAGGAAIAGSRLDLSGGTGKNLTYTATNKINAAVGTIKFKYIPNYTGNPAGTVDLIRFKNADGVSTASNSNEIRIKHDTASAWRLDVKNNVGGAVVTNQGFGTSVLTSGTSYEIEFNWDFLTGAHRLFIDGVQQGGTQTWTSTRSNNTTDVTYLKLGETYANNFVEDLVIYTAVQHTTNYTPGYTLEETKYLADLITYPLFTYSGVGNITSFNSLTTTETGVVRHSMNGFYWNGSAWVASDNSYAQMNSTATINSNISSLPNSNTLQVRSRFSAQSTLKEDLDNFSVQFDGQIYPTSNPKITPNSLTLVDGLSSFAVTTSEPAGTAVQFTLSFQGQEKWWNGSAWVNSNGTFAESSTSTDINTNIGSLDLSSGGTFKPVAYLNSDGTDLCSITQIIYDYSFYIAPTAPNECIVYGWVYDVAGDAVQNATVNFRVVTPFFYGENLIARSATATTDVLGYFELSLVETETLAETMKCVITYVDNSVTKTKTYSNLVIPNKASESFAQITIDAG